MNRLILIFLKYPEPGQVKTRLAASVGPDAAALIYQRLVSDLFLQLAESDSSTSIRFAVEPADRQGELENWIKELWGDSPHFIDFVPQAGGTLGERLRESVKDAFLEGHAPVLILGSDCPEVTPQILEDAWKALETSDVVFGPALDGGYYLAAFRQFEPQLFEVPWSAENTLEVSLRKADELGLKTHQLLPLTDVDELKDWQGYQDRLLHQRPNAAPLRFHPLYKERVWGGRTLETRYGRDLPSDAPYGESWELVDRAGEQSQIIQGDLAGFTLHDLWERDRDLWFGPGLEGERFPLLVKILDARDDLSLQVHPPDSVAASLDGEPKTEMWYVAHAEPGARIYVGVNEGVTPESFRASLEDGTAASQVHVIEPQAGDFLFIPSGRLHAIGAGLLIYEIQENSDTTYRVFDWNRLGLDGNPRQLHLEEAMRCIDFEDIEPSATQRARDTLVKCRQFHVRQWSLAEGEQRSVSAEPKDQRFVIIGVVEGIISCGGHRFEPGDFFLVPAFAAKELMLQAESAVSLLHTTIPEGTTDPRMALEPGRSDRRNVSPSPPIPTPERSMDPQNSPPSLTPPMETPPPPLDQSKHEGFYRELRAKMLQWAETKAGGNHPWMNYLLLAPDLFHLLLNLAADRNVPGQQKLMLGGVITYFVLPIDLFPEGIFGPVGFLDDVALASFALHQMMNLVDPETVRRHWAGELDSLEKAREVALRADELLGSGLVRRLRKQFGV